MQITETLNDQQRLMDLSDKQMLFKCYPIFNEMVEAGYETEFYYVGGFGGLTIVPSMGRIRVKANQGALSDFDYCSKLAEKVRQAFESRLTNPKFLASQKMSIAFKNKKGKYRV